MAIFEVEGPDGKIYEVEAPDMKTAASAFASFAAAGTRQEQESGGVLKNLAAGIGRGLTGMMDAPGAFLSGGMNLAADGLESLGANADFVQGVRSSIGGTPLSGSAAREAASAATGGGVDMVPNTRSEKMAATVGEFLPGGAAFKAPIALGAIPGVASELAGWATEGVNVPDNVPLVGGKPIEPAARVAGAMSGPAIANAARRVVTPYPADSARVAAADALNKEGVAVTAGQKTGREALKYREAMSPRTTQIVADQNQQFTRAALKRIGVDADRATPEVMKSAVTRIGDEFKRLSAATEIKPFSGTATKAADVVKGYRAVTAKSNISPIIGNIAKNLGQSVKSGQAVSGKQYNAWRSQLSKLTTSSDAQLANAAKDMIEVLDGAMNRSLVATGQSMELRAFSKARKQWQDYMAIETAVSRAGEETAAGIISPQTLRNAIVAQGKRPYVLGKRDLGELARNGATVTGKLPQTGAFPRITDMGATTGTGAGLLAYGITKDPAIAGAVGMASTAAPALRNAASASAAGQAYLGNQAVTGSTPLSQSLFPLLFGSTEQK